MGRTERDRARQRAASLSNSKLVLDSVASDHMRVRQASTALRAGDRSLFCIIADGREVSALCLHAPRSRAHTKSNNKNTTATFHQLELSGMRRGMMVPNVCVNLSSEEAPDFKLERIRCRLKKKRCRFIVISSSQNAYREDLRKNDCSESSRFLHTRAGWVEVVSALTLPVP